LDIKRADYQFERWLQCSTDIRITDVFRTWFSRDRLGGYLFVAGGELKMDSSFLKLQAIRCRELAGKADQFTKRRLLDLAQKYDDRLQRPLRASRTLGLTADLREEPRLPKSASSMK
jgi:hypothetical protein